MPDNFVNYKTDGILKFLVQPDKIKQGGTNELRKNNNRRTGRDFSFAL
jgi:hypothetical protein